jgi:acetyl-CoA C-acetyltransferase
MKEQGMQRVAVLGGVRIPFCRSHTAYAELSNLDMLTASLTGLIDRFSLHGAHIDEAAPWSPTPRTGTLRARR